MVTRRLPPLAISAATIAAALVMFAACKQGDTSIACNVDVDCPQNFVCRTNVCLSLLAADASTQGDGAVLVCLNPGDACNTDDQCCTPPCRNFRCVTGTGSSGKSSSGSTSSGSTSGTSGTSGASSSGAGCTDLFGICAVDSECCTGLTCTMGSCR
jgi:uncharacterized membrane protein YgcG